MSLFEQPVERKVLPKMRHTFVIHFRDVKGNINEHLSEHIIHVNFGNKEIELVFQDDAANETRSELEKIAKVLDSIAIDLYDGSNTDVSSVDQFFKCQVKSVQRGPLSRHDTGTACTITVVVSYESDKWLPGNATNTTTS